MSENTTYNQDSSDGVKFVIEKIYVNELSLEMPNIPEIFLEKETPKTKVDLKVDVRKLEAPFFHVSILVMLNAQIKDQTLFVLELVQSGIFQASGFDENHLLRLLNIDCAYILLPYAREAVSSTLVRAGCPPMYLSPINFEVLFEASQNTKQ